MGLFLQGLDDELGGLGGGRGVLTGDDSSIAYRVFRKVGRGFYRGAEPFQFRFKKKWNDVGEFHRSFFLIGKHGERFPFHQWFA